MPSTIRLQAAFSKDINLRVQIQDAAGSVIHSIAEGFDAGTDPEFVRFPKLARRSAGEVQSQLYLALDRRYITAGQLDATYELATETERLINGMVSYLRKSTRLRAERRTASRGITD